MIGQSTEEKNKADITLKEHEIKSDIAGEFKRLYRRAGESIKAFEPVAEIQTRHCSPQTSAGPSRRHSNRIGPLPPSSGPGDTEPAIACTAAQASASALDRILSMLTLIMSAAPDASCRRRSAAPSVPKLACLF